MSIKISRAKDALRQRPSRRDCNQTEGGNNSTTTSTDGSLCSRDLSRATWGGGGGGRSSASDSSGVFGEGNVPTKIKKQKQKVRLKPEALLSRVAVSVTIPQPEQYGDTIVIADTSHRATASINGRTSPTATASTTPTNGGVAGVPSSASTHATVGKQPTTASADSGVSSETIRNRSLKCAATIRLDVVGERGAGSAAGEGASGGAGVGFGTGGGFGGEHALARSDSSAQALLTWYSDEQVNARTARPKQEEERREKKCRSRRPYTFTECCRCCCSLCRG